MASATRSSPRFPLQPARPGPRPRPRDRADGRPRRALRRLHRARMHTLDRSPGRRRLHQRIGGGQPAPGGRRSRSGGRAPDRPHVRQAARAARHRRRTDDRPDRPLRLRLKMVLRGRHPRRRRHRPAAHALARLPRLGGGDARPRAGAPQPLLARPTRARAAPRGRDGRAPAGGRGPLGRTTSDGADRRSRAESGASWKRLRERSRAPGVA